MELPSASPVRYRAIGLIVLPVLWLSLGMLTSALGMVSDMTEAWEKTEGLEGAYPSSMEIIDQSPVTFVKDTKPPFYFLSNLQGVNFGGGNFDHANFTGANLQQTLFQKATFRGANLFLANLQESNLNEANMEGANLTGANLQQASLFKANLENVTLLHGNLRDANLLLANLQGAYVANANFLHADLRGANLATVVGLTQEQLNQACVDEATLLPPSLVRPAPCVQP